MKKFDSIEEIESIREYLNDDVVTICGITTYLNRGGYRMDPQNERDYDIFHQLQKEYHWLKIRLS